IEDRKRREGEEEGGVGSGMARNRGRSGVFAGSPKVMEGGWFLIAGGENEEQREIGWFASVVGVTTTFHRRREE
ncbi:hypothetical protein HAX54_003259, partial [Datura stramonium]|nr:hypothetical protein [Datura stramonium]